MRTDSTSRSKQVVIKQLWAAGIAIVSFALVMLTLLPGPFFQGMSAVDDLFYDIFYKLRPMESRSAGNVVIVTADEPSIEEIIKQRHHDWPWPRSFWGSIAGYAAHSGARAVVFDILFKGDSEYNGKLPDDKDFAKAILGAKNAQGRPVPVVFGRDVDPADGSFKPFGPQIPDPHFGVVTLENTRVFTKYPPYPYGKESLATAAIVAAGEKPLLTTPFKLHYYGPGQADPGEKTFIYLPAVNVFKASQMKGDVTPSDVHFSPDIFRDRIVLLGSSAAGAFDLKTSPISSVYPGVEVHATAIEDMLAGEKVSEFPTAYLILLPLLISGWSAFGVILPKSASYKLLFPALAMTALLGVGVIIFRRTHIWWLPPAHSILALFLATPSAFAYTYFVEDRQSRFMLRALKKVVSPTVAEELSERPDRLERNTRPRLLTVLFSDLANFTSLSEWMKEDNQALVALLDDYFEAMSREVIAQDGTLDKYIGDSIMCFWNAPIEQKDHAIRACRAAVAMRDLKKEYSIPSKEPGKPDQQVYTRIGINTAVANYGFVGSSNLMNYTVLGDGVNLASRLEGANKLYGTRILIAQDTAKLVESDFYLRKIDRLRVKGKNQSIEVFELQAERNSANGLDPEMRAITEKYHAAFEQYLQQNWADARRILLESCDQFGEDKPSKVLLGRVDAYSLHPPGPDWDGAYGAVDK